MGVAIVGAAGVILAALVSIVVSLIQANEKSARLLREAETLAKLPPDSTAYRLMEEHLTRSIGWYQTRARVADEVASIRQSANMAALFTGALVAWSAVAQAVDVQHWSRLYEFIWAVIAIHIAIWTIAFAAGLSIMGWEVFRARKAKRESAPRGTPVVPTRAD